MRSRTIRSGGTSESARRASGTVATERAFRPCFFRKSRRNSRVAPSSSTITTYPSLFAAEIGIAWDGGEEGGWRADELISPLGKVKKKQHPPFGRVSTEI